MPKRSTTQCLAEVRKLLGKTPLIDGHNDLPWQIQRHGGRRIDLRSGTRHLKIVTDIPRLRAGFVSGQFWAVYVPATLSGPQAIKAVFEQIDLVHRLVAKYSDAFELALTAEDIRRVHGKGRIASLIGVEGGHSIGNSLAVLRMLYRLGARYLTLTHTKTTDWADAAGDKPQHQGLTAFGESVVREMNRLGMLVDLSHVSDQTMRDALQISRAPVIFSHSSARGVCAHARNVPDDILKLTARNGGVVMVCFLPAYVSEQARASAAAAEAARRKRRRRGFPTNPARLQEKLIAWHKAHASYHEASLSQVADHIDHIRKMIGSDHIGIGSDFDGFFGATQELEDVSKFPALLAELLRRGYTKTELKKIAGLNLLRVFREAERVAQRLQGKSGASDAARGL